MNSPILQFIFILAFLYGLTTIFVELKIGTNKLNKNQIGLSVAIIICSLIAFLTTIN